MVFFFFEKCHFKLVVPKPRAPKPALTDEELAAKRADIDDLEEQLRQLKCAWSAPHIVEHIAPASRTVCLCFAKECFDD